MGFVFGSLFWGVVLLVAGITIIINVIFHIHIPIFRIIVGAVLVYWGFQIVFKTGGCTRVKTDNNVVFDNADFSCKAGKNWEYDIVFSKGKVDLTQWKNYPEANYCSVSVVFGSGVVIVDPKTPIIISSESVFGEVVLPNSSSVNFGSKVYRSDGANAGINKNNVKRLKIESVFSSVHIIEQATKDEEVKADPKNAEDF